MRLRGGVPGERVAGALGAGARRGERARILEQLPKSPGSASTSSGGTTRPAAKRSTTSPSPPTS